MPIVRGFRRFRSNIVSSRQVVTETSKLVPGSNVQQSERSSSAPLTSKRPLRKKVTTADRRAMLESFVDKYRALNLGKFPPTTSAQKEVGGSYYFIKKMLQEMEYDSKLSSEDKGPVKENKRQTKREVTISRETAEESSGSQEVSTTQINVDQQVFEDPWLESSSNLHTNFELKEGVQPSTSSADTKDNDITRDDIRSNATKSDDRRGQFHEHNVKDESPSEDNIGYVDSKSKVDNQHDGIRNIIREMPEREKASLWGNLKSLASGLINIWKK